MMTEFVSYPDVIYILVMAFASLHLNSEAIIDEKHIFILYSV